MKSDDQPNYGNSKSMALESAKTSLLKNKKVLEEITKKVSIPSKSQENSLLDETQIRE